MYNKFMDIPSFYKIIHQDTDTNHYLVMNEVTNEVCLMKILKVYDVSVFEYLKHVVSPHLPRVYEYQENDNELMVIEEYIKGDTLSDYILKNRPSEEEIIGFLGQLCDTLKLLHSAPKPIIHRDLKPTNIMITSEGVVKLIDYDAAKTFSPGKTQDTVFLGTPDVAAPEQYGFAQSDSRTDIFAMGKLIEKICPDSRHFKTVVTKATHLDPVDRYQTIDELKNAINGTSGNTLLRRLLIVPGFRRKNVFHALAAVPYYLFTLFMVINIGLNNANLEHWTIGRHIFYRVETFIIFMVPIDIFFKWTGLWDHAPFLKTKDKLVYNIIGAVYVLIVIVLFRLANTFLVDILFPYK